MIFGEHNTLLQPEIIEQSNAENNSVSSAIPHESPFEDSQSLLSVPGTSPSNIIAMMNPSSQVYQQLPRSGSDNPQKRTGQGRR